MASFDPKLVDILPSSGRKIITQMLQATLPEKPEPRFSEFGRSVGAKLCPTTKECVWDKPLQETKAAAKKVFTAENIVVGAVSVLAADTFSLTSAGTFLVTMALGPQLLVAAGVAVTGVLLWHGGKALYKKLKSD